MKTTKAAGTPVRAMLLIFLHLFLFLPELHAQQQSEEVKLIAAEQLDRWSEFFRGWRYYPEIVVSASLERDLGFTMVDGPNVYWHNDQWNMLYFGFGGKGYQACRAVSNDLLRWEPGSLVVSRDLVRWRRYEGNPVIGNNPNGYDALLAANPDVYRDGDHWVMLYSGPPETPRMKRSARTRWSRSLWIC